MKTNKKIYVCIICIITLISTLGISVSAGFNVTSAKRLIPIQGTHSISQYSYNEHGTLSSNMTVPLNSQYMNVEDSNIETWWQAEFFYSDFSSPSIDGENGELHVRNELKMNDTEDIYDTIENSIKATWGKGSKAKEITTNIAQRRQINTYTINGLYFHDENNVYSVTPNYRTIGYRMNNVMMWENGDIPNDSPNPYGTSILSALYISKHHLSQFWIDGTHNFDDIQVKNTWIKAHNVADPSIIYQSSAPFIEVTYSEEKSRYELYVGFEDFIGQGELWCIDEAYCEITFNQRHVVTEYQPIKLKYETVYTTIKNVDEITFELVETKKIELPNTIDLASWLVDGVSGFFNMQIIPGLSIGGILGIFLAFSIVMWLFKMFLGG